MDIAGIDYSTHYVDIVRIGDDHPPAWYRYELHGADSFDRCRSVPVHVVSRASIWWDDVLAVGIEEPAGRNTGHLFRVQGAILSQIPPRMLVEKWMPSQWRKAVGLPGNCSKSDVWEYAQIALGVSHYVGERGKATMAVTPGGEEPIWPQDACDAFCIALATKHALERQAA